MKNNRIDLNEYTKFEIENDTIRIHQLDWRGKDYTTVYLKINEVEKIYNLLGGIVKNGKTI